MPSLKPRISAYVKPSLADVLKLWCKSKGIFQSDGVLELLELVLSSKIPPILPVVPTGKHRISALMDDSLFAKANDFMKNHKLVISSFVRAAIYLGLEIRAKEGWGIDDALKPVRSELGESLFNLEAYLENRTDENLANDIYKV